MEECFLGWAAVVLHVREQLDAGDPFPRCPLTPTLPSTARRQTSRVVVSFHLMKNIIFKEKTTALLYVVFSCQATISGKCSSLELFLQDILLQPLSYSTGGLHWLQGQDCTHQYFLASSTAKHTKKSAPYS